MKDILLKNKFIVGLVAGTVVLFVILTILQQGEKAKTVEEKGKYEKLISSNDTLKKSIYPLTDETKKKLDAGLKEAKTAVKALKTKIKKEFGANSRKRKNWDNYDGPKLKMVIDPRLKAMRKRLDASGVQVELRQNFGFGMYVTGTPNASRDEKKALSVLVDITDMVVDVVAESRVHSLSSLLRVNKLKSVVGKNANKVEFTEQ